MSEKKKCVINIYSVYTINHKCQCCFGKMMINPSPQCQTPVAGGFPNIIPIYVYMSIWYVYIISLYYMYIFKEYIICLIYM